MSTLFFGLKSVRQKYVRRKNVPVPFLFSEGLTSAY